MLGVLEQRPDRSNRTYAGCHCDNDRCPKESSIESNDFVRQRCGRVIEIVNFLGRSLDLQSSAQLFCENCLQDKWLSLHLPAAVSSLVITLHPLLQRECAEAPGEVEQPSRLEEEAAEAAVVVVPVAALQDFVFLRTQVPMCVHCRAMPIVNLKMIKATQPLQ
jgi:hypothetical protein